MLSRLPAWLKTPIPGLHRRPALSAAARKFWRVLAWVFWLLLSFFVGYFVGWRVLLYREVNRQFAQIRAAGFPVSGAELNSWLRPVPDPENGALVLTQAFALLRTLPDGRAKALVSYHLLTRTNQWSAETVELVGNHVRTNSAALARAHEALLLPRFRYPVDYAYGPLSDMPHCPELKRLAYLAALQASFHTAQGRAEDWPAEAELQLKLAATLDEEPTLMPHQIRQAIIRMAVQTTERNLNRTSPSKQACLKLRQAFTKAASTNLLPFALATERALTIPVFRLSWKEIQTTGNDRPEPQRYSGTPWPFLWLCGFFERDLNFYLETMEKGISLAALPQNKSWTMTNLLENAGRSAEKKYYILSSLLLPSLSRLTVREVSAQVQIELAQTALALEGFRRDRGRLPEDLKELAPEFLETVPMDPFAGAPVRYRRLAPGYVLYSIDADGHDDGGREKPERKQSNDNTTYDLTFTVER